MKKTLVNPKDAPAPWQFNQAIKVTAPGSILFCSGIVGIDAEGKIAKGDILKQAEVAYGNLKKVVEAGGGTLKNVVKTNVYVGENYQLHKEQLRAIRSRFFTEEHPATTLLQVAGYANDDYLFEIEAIAVLD